MTLTGDPSPLVLAQRYQIEERIGAGSMGAVWLATDRLLGRAVAVKQLLIHPGLPGFDAQGYEEAKQRILREGRLAARLQHPHTISVFDVVLHDDAPWLVMEYLPSRTLGALLDEEGPIEPRRAAGIGTQIADGLAAAHAAGIVHRDIKPGNVLIGADGKVKITDFGVSRAADDVQLTRTGMIAGTPAFLAPEIARGRTPTSAADVFALGSTLYAAVEGLPPFGLDDNAYALLYAVGEGKISLPEQAGPLTEPLMRMLRKEPTERPSAAQARDELAAVAAGRVVPVTEGAADRAGTIPAPALSAGPSVPAVLPEPGDSGQVGVSPPNRALTPTVVDVSPVPTALAAPPAPARLPKLPTASTTRGPIVLGAAVLVVAVLLVAGIAVLLHTRGSSGGPPTSSAPAPTAGPAPAAPSAVAPVPSRDPVTGQPTPAQLEDLVRDYYALLPGNPAAAWQMLGPLAQSASGGFDGYQGFYRSLDAVSFADGPTAVDGSTVHATLHFQPKSGGETNEPYAFTVVPGPDGKLIISSFVHR